MPVRIRRLLWPILGGISLVLSICATLARLVENPEARTPIAEAKAFLAGYRLVESRPIRPEGTEAWFAAPEPLDAEARRLNRFFAGRDGWKPMIDDVQARVRWRPISLVSALKRRIPASDGHLGEEITIELLPVLPPPSRGGPSTRAASAVDGRFKATVFAKITVRNLEASF